MAGETTQAAAYNEQRAQRFQETGGRPRVPVTRGEPRPSPAVLETQKHSTDRYYAVDGGRAARAARAKARVLPTPPRAAPVVADFAVGSPEAAAAVIDAALQRASAEGGTVTVRCADRRSFAAARTRLDLRAPQFPGLTPRSVRLTLAGKSIAPAPPAAGDLPPVADTAEADPLAFLRQPAATLPEAVAEAVAATTPEPLPLEDTDDEMLAGAVPADGGAVAITGPATPAAYDVPDLTPATEPAAPRPRPGRRSGRGAGN